MRLTRWGARSYRRITVYALVFGLLLPAVGLVFGFMDLARRPSLGRSAFGYAAVLLPWESSRFSVYVA